MTNINTKAATVLGLSLIIGLSALGFLVQQMAVKFKEYERVVAGGGGERAV
ncbi:periplasmic protein [Vibrio cholerae]|nr:periplasmic protein [Vibrio cholerae]